MTKNLFLFLFLLSVQNTQVFGQNISTIARTGSASFSTDWNNNSEPINSWMSDLILDSAGNIFYTDGGVNQIKKIDIITGLTSVIAGTGGRGCTGDNGLAVNAEVEWPSSLKFDKSGNLLFLNCNCSRVRKIDMKTGIISLIAGDTGVVPGYSGDGGPAIKATLNGPTNICLDDSDNIYITDTYNARIRKISNRTKIIETIAGNGIHKNSGNGGLAVNATLNIPIGITIDKANNIYVSGYETYLRKINLSTGIIDSTKIIGGENILFQYPNKIWATNGCSIVQTNIATNLMKIIAGKKDSCGYSGDGGLATNAKIKSSGSVAEDTNRGVIYFMDAYNERIRMVLNSPTPAPKVKSPIFFCRNSPITLTASGINLKWYPNAIGGIGSHTAPTIDYNTTKYADTLVYFVSQEIGGFESVRVPIVLYAKYTPSAPYSPDVHFCLNQIPIRLTVSGGDNYTWYLDSFKFAPTKTPPLPNTNKIGITNFFVTQTEVNGCESDLRKVTVTVHHPELPIFNTPIELCFGRKAEQLYAEGENLRWYSSLNSDIGTIIAPTPKTDQFKDQTYYITQTDSFGCASDTGIIDVYVHPTPPKPFVKSQYQYCINQLPEVIFGMGVNLKWFDKDTIFIGKASPIPQTKIQGKQVFFATQTNTLGCVSDLAKIEVNVNPNPSLTFEEKISKPFAGLPLTLNCSSDFGKTFLWNTGDTQTSLIYIPKNEGRHYFWVQSTSELGCKSDTLWHYVDITPSKYWESDYEVYPNPFVNRIHLSNINLNDIMSVNLYSLNGIKVFQSEMPLKSLEINIPDWLLGGMYLLEVNTVGRANPTRLVYKK